MFAYIKLVSGCHYCCSCIFKERCIILTALINPITGKKARMHWIPHKPKDSTESYSTYQSVISDFAYLVSVQEKVHFQVLSGQLCILSDTFISYWFCRLSGG
ncbi:hypothetical protein XENOCAPTIV_006451 [Xenoophorus captivus]|uniref:Uncharacterized protein n=1 Tax=Xenoophorus captivus TaxID=1517983 RepID=A0ABV0SGE3_9TELE